MKQRPDKVQQDISEELFERKTVICLRCGAIVAGYENDTIIDVPCPFCGKDGLFWITPTHTWLLGIRELAIR